MDVSLNQQTYERMKKDILTFVLKPGDPVSARKIAERYKVSRTPAREALVRLQDEGMVEIFPQSKSEISRINVRQIRQEWFVRKSLELGMVDSFFDKVREEDLREMDREAEILKRIGDEPRNHETSFEYLLCDDRFHAIMYRVAEEHLAARIIGNTLPNYRRMRLLIDLDNINKDRTVADHRSLIRLAENRDREGFRRSPENHLSHIIDDM